ncbi:MAG: HipA domain-containing protein [Stellaceae bacterium]
MAQSSTQLIDVSKWRIDEDFPIFPVGSKPKRLLRCPEEAPQPFLIPGHSYLFKVAHDWRAQQLWSEVIAYRIAADVGLQVPPCFVAIDSLSGELGALVEFFYGYPDEAEPASFVHAADFLERFRVVGTRTDRPHFIRLNLNLCRVLRLANSVGWWGRVLTFDALIGNSDRHPENWGFLKRIGSERNASWAIAPAFDNGTSLGYEIREERMLEFSNPIRLEAYVDAGCHHCGWDSSSDHRTPHIDLCRRLVDAFPAVQDQTRRVIAIGRDQIQKILDDCSEFDVSVPFTRGRAHFVAELIEARRRRLSAIAGN